MLCFRTRQERTPKGRNKLDVLIANLSISGFVSLKHEGAILPSQPATMLNISTEANQGGAYIMVQTAPGSWRTIMRAQNV